MSALFFALAAHDTARQSETLLSIFLSAIPGGPWLAVPLLCIIFAGIFWQFARDWIYGAIDGLRTFFAVGGHK